MKRVLSNWWVVTGLIVLLLVLVFAVGLPLFVTMLQPWWVRGTIVLVLVAGWLIAGWLRARKASRADAAIAAELAQPSAADQESGILQTRMAEALAALKAASGKRRDYLYSRPWYVIIGPPGAGKTTALLNSGLRFPFADQSLKGVGGTRNLDFWFADEAALVDTAGRYTTQDSDASVDAQGWKSFLTLMKKHRPASPINGVLVTIGVDELLKGSRANLDSHAAAVRRRLAELRATLEVSVPVYLILTKADLLAGFVEYYDDLDVEGRRAVLGATLTAGQRPDLAAVLTAFDDVVAAQGERQAKRLYDEVDQTRRGLILGFPAQLAALRNRLARFVEGAFIAGDQPAGMLRGFYLTSGVQEGAPLDRILAGVADVYDVTPGQRGHSGRTYFLNRLLGDVVFAEAGLVQTDPAALARQRMRMTMGVGAVAAVALFVVALWGVSFIQNRAFQSSLLAASQQAQTLTRETGVDLVEVRDTDPDLEQSLVILRALRNLPQGFAEQAAGEPGLFKRFGLFQTGHATRALEAYHDGLRRILLPRLLLRLETAMAENASNPMGLYEPLKVYLMLGGQGPLDKATVKAWAAGDWAGQVLPGSDRAGVRRELAQHLAAMLDDQNLAAAWPGRKAPVDGTAIASARASLQTLSLADRAYAILKQRATVSGGTPWMASAVLASGDAQAFANGEEVLAQIVPYFFTRAGYEKAYQLRLATVQNDLKSELWVMGEDAATAGVQAQMGSIRSSVAALYSRDYIDAWDRVLAALRPGAYFEDRAAFGAFTKTPSPLKVLLLEVRKNTTFAGGSAGAKRLATEAAASRFGRLNTVAGGVMPGGGGSIDAGADIAAYFRPVHDYVGDGKVAAPIDEFIAALKQAGSAIMSANAAAGGLGADAVQGQAAMAIGAVSATAATGAPPQLQGFLSSAISGGTKAQVGAAKGAITEAYAQSVLPDCRAATTDKYPFYGSSQVDAAMIDVQRVFGPSGVMDGFVQQRAMPLLDTAGPVWRWKSDNALATTLDPASPDELAKAGEIRDMLVAGVSMTVEMQSFGAGADAAELAAGGTNYRFDPATSGQRPLMWSAQGSLPQAAVTLFKGGTQVAKVEALGPWALFRLMDKARRENAGPRTFLASFGEGDRSVILRVGLPGERNPFSRGGPWSFRCPVML